MPVNFNALVHHPPPGGGVVVWLVIIALAVVRGGRPERFAAILLLCDLAVMLSFPDPPVRMVVHWHLLLTDVAVLGGLVWITFVSARSWTLWALAFQALAVTAHAPRLIYSGVWTSSYIWVVNSSGYLVISALLAGVLIEACRDGRRRSG